jgi:hypothetical protein
MAAAYVDVHLHLIFRHDSTRPRHTAARAGGASTARTGVEPGVEPGFARLAMLSQGLRCRTALCPLPVDEPNIRSNPAATHSARAPPRRSRAGVQQSAQARKRGTARARRTHLGPQETRKEV